jgi:hypothetical protein
VVRELCSGEVLGSKFTIPCNGVDHLNKMYGENYAWLQPLKEKYPMNSVSVRSARRWEESEIPYILRAYNAAGFLDVKSTLRMINTYFSRPELYITSVPSDNKFNSD